MSTGPLNGIRVLDIATILAAPFGGTLLADYGADVVKVELPGKGDGMRDFPPFKDGKGLWWKAAQRNKTFITLDLRKTEGTELLLQMLPQFDVLLENFRVGTLDKWGLTREKLWEANPNLVILRATAFGQTGPYANKPGFARMFEAMSGMTYITGEEDRMPMHVCFPMGDAIGGLFGAISVLTALLGIAKGNIEGGEEIDLSLTEAMYRLFDVHTVQYDQLGVNAERSGNESSYSAPANVYRTGDGHYISLSGSTQSTFSGNARAIGRPDLLEDARFATNAQRYRYRDELNTIFGQWFSKTPLADVLEAFERENGTLAPIYNVEQILSDPQFQAREAVISVPDHDFGQIKMPAVVPRFAKVPGAVRNTGGSVGQDNDRFFREQLNLSNQEIEDLTRAGVI